MTPHEGDQLPPDPFEADLPEFVLEGPHAPEIIGYVREFAAAKEDYNALVQQQSFRQLHIAISALTDEQARRALLRAVASAVSRHLNDGSRFAAWVEKQ